MNISGIPTEMKQEGWVDCFLIIVVVTMDFMAQAQSYMMSQQYDSLLKKANFKGAGLPTR